MAKTNTEVAKPASTEMQDMQAIIAAKLAAQNAVRGQLAGGAAYISFKSGHLTIDGSPVPSGEVDVIPLAIAFERTKYLGEYDADKPQSPICFTFNGQFPHEEAAEPQNPTCKGCPHDAWGSGPRGKGKACRESARLAVIAADSDPATASIYTAKVPISSISTVKDLLAYATSHGKLTGQLVTRLTCKPDPKSIFKVSLTPLREVTAPLEELMPRILAAEETVNAPYRQMDEEVGTSKKY